MRLTDPHRRFGLLLALVLLAAAAFPTGRARAASPWEKAAADTYRFPGSMKVVNVKKAFGAVGDGKTDDTAALRKAFDQRAAFVYLPNGTYLVRDPIQYTSGPGIGPTIQGESRDGVVIRLADDAEGFDNPDKPRAVVRLIRDGKVSADYFKIRIRNLTIDAGKHRGATGLTFYANNNGQCRNVRIVGKGAAGLDLSYRLNGPLLVSNVEIEGFDVGVKAGSGPYNSQTLEHVVVRNPHRYGIENDGEALFVRDLQFSGETPAVYSRANLTLIDSRLSGKGDAAIVCSGPTFVRNVKTSGYGAALQQRQRHREGMGAGAHRIAAEAVEEWSSDKRLTTSGSAARSLRLPVELAPYKPVAAEAPDRWVCVDDFGADGADRNDDTEAFRKAFAHAKQQGRKVICLAADGRYVVSGDLAVDGSIERIQGAGSYIQPGRGKRLRFLVRDGAAGVVTFDLVDRPLGRHHVVVENASSRTVVVNHLRCHLVASGTGKTFLEDSAANVRITNAEHRVWVRQLNSENSQRDGLNNENRGGMLWVLGLKSERDQTLIRTVDGGKSEVLGAWVYQTLRTEPNQPLFEHINAAGSYAGVTQYNWRGNVYPVLLRAVDSGKETSLTKADNDGRGSFSLLVDN